MYEMYVYEIRKLIYIHRWREYAKFGVRFLLSRSIKYCQLFSLKIVQQVVTFHRKEATQTTKMLHASLLLNNMSCKTTAKNPPDKTLCNPFKET